ncbi:hypothetical protein B0T18DRAFT_424275 [Schizothecium vesticola]|uniref:Uncharacterized protein n=1 Tax=Schizothecium vesticola TaxID=314040 RepID=A0AA40F9M2_9PEZI|nr:hypothetical protein B0T18DRAFT_424275 [Schizothecium vesticola]
MAAHAEIVDIVAQLSDLGAELVEEITFLANSRSCLDRRFHTNLSHLNRTILQLPAVIDVLMFEKPPRPELTSASADGQLVAAPSNFKSGGRHSTLGGKVQAVMADMFRVEREMQSSYKEASRNRIATADLVSKAARHSDLCSSAARTVSEAQDKMQWSLKEANRRMASAEEKAAGTNAASQLMADQAKRHEKKGRRNKILFWVTVLIPIVNVATTLHSLSVEAKNNELAESYRTAAAAVTAKHATATAEKQRLEAARSKLNTALEDLSLAQRQAERQAQDIEELRDQARALTDKYGIVTTRLWDVVRR